VPGRTRSGVAPAATSSTPTGSTTSRATAKWCGVFR